MGQSQNKDQLSVQQIVTIQDQEQIDEEKQQFESVQQQHKRKFDQNKIWFIPINLFKQDFNLLNITYSLSFYKNIYLSDIQKIQFILVKIHDSEQIHKYLNNLESFGKLMELKKMQFDIIDITSLYFQQFINAIDNILMLQDIIIFTREESIISQIDILLLMEWIKKQTDLKKLTLSFKLPYMIDSNLTITLNQLTHLQKLKLEFADQCQFEQVIFIQLGDSLKHMSGLMVFSIQIQTDTSNLDSVSINKFSEGFKNLLVLEQFSFSLKQNKLSHEEIESIYNILNNLNSIRLFDISIKQNNYIERQNVSQSFIKKKWNSIQKYNPILKYNPIWNANINQKINLFKVLYEDQLKNLTYLILNFQTQFNNSCSMSQLNQLLKYTINLETFQLTLGDYSEFNKSDLNEFGLSLKNLVNLKDFEMIIGEYNQFNYDTACSLMNGIKSLKNLIRLFIVVEENNYVDERTIEVIYEGISQLINLSTMFIDLNHPYQMLFLGLLQNIYQLDNSYLDIFYNNDFIFSRQSQTNNLVLMNLKLSNIGEDSAKGLVQALKKLSYLEYLHLQIHDSMVSQNSYKQLGEVMKQLNNLICLSIDIKDQDPTKLKCFGKNLKDMRNLSFLLITIYEINGIGEWLQDLTNLIKLSIKVQINDNDTLKDIYLLQDYLSNLKKLKYIYLDFYQNYSIDQYPDSLSSINKIYENIPNLENLTIKINDHKSEKGITEYLAQSFFINMNYLKSIKKLTLLFSNYKETFNQQDFKIKNFLNGLRQLNNLSYLSLQIEKNKKDVDFQHLQTLNDSIDSQQNLLYLSLNIELFESMSAFNNNILLTNLQLTIQKMKQLQFLNISNPKVSKYFQQGIIRKCQQLIFYQLYIKK